MKRPTDLQPVSPEALTAYRDAVNELVAKCVRGVRAFDLPVEAEPLQTWTAAPPQETDDA